jgi:hypothetical protein
MKMTRSQQKIVAISPHWKELAKTMQIEFQKLHGSK